MGSGEPPNVSQKWLGAIWRDSCPFFSCQSIISRHLRDGIYIYIYIVLVEMVCLIVGFKTDDFVNNFENF
jgi:hypothetical protein